MISKNLDKIIEGVQEVFLLDLSWHLHRSYHSFQWMTVNMGGYERPTGHIFGVLYTLQTIRNAYPNSVIILCKDGVPVDRLELYQGQETTYKEGREELEFNFYNDIPTIEAMTYMLPRTYLAFHPQKESDDIMYALAKQIEQISSAKVFIYSGDDDLLQSISEQTVVVRKCDKGLFEEIDNHYLLNDETMLKKFHGVDSYHLPYYRVIIGDKSDKMKGIPRFPRELAALVAMSCESLDDIFNVENRIPLEKPSYKKYLQVLKESENTIRLNYGMMKLSDEIDVPISRRKVKPEFYTKTVTTLKLGKFSAYVESLNKKGCWVEDLGGKKC